MESIEKLDELKVEIPESLTQNLDMLRSCRIRELIIVGTTTATILGLFFGLHIAVPIIMGLISAAGLISYIAPFSGIADSEPHFSYHKLVAVPLAKPLSKSISLHNERINSLGRFVGVGRSLSQNEDPGFQILIERQIDKLNGRKRELEALCRFFEAAKDVKIGEFDSLGDIFTEEAPELGVSLKDSFEDTLRRFSARIDVDSSLNGIESLETARQRKLGKN